MTEPQPSLLRRILRIPAEIVVGLYVVLDGLIGPLFRPIMRFLSSLRIVRRMEAAIAALPPYVILVLLVVPFAVAELAKVYAVYLMAEDHVRTGMTIFVGAYVVSILVCERIFHAGKERLMTIGWFKIVFDWVMAVKNRVFEWLRETAIWRMAADLRERARQMLRRTRQRLQAAFGLRPKGTLEQR